MLLLVDFEDCLDLNRDIFGKTSHTKGAANSDAIFTSKNLRKQFATSIDDIGLLLKIGGSIHHSQNFDHPFYPVQ